MAKVFTHLCTKAQPESSVFNFLCTQTYCNKMQPGQTLQNCSNYAVHFNFIPVSIKMFTHFCARVQLKFPVFNFLCNQTYCNKVQPSQTLQNCSNHTVHFNFILLPIKMFTHFCARVQLKYPVFNFLCTQTSCNKVQPG